MALNQYFSRGTRNESALHESLIIESIQMFGMDVVYIPRKIIGEDVILNEDVLSRFDESFVIEMYLENMEQFDGEGDLMSRFGFTIKDSAKFVVANKRWNELIGSHGYDKGTASPQHGDLIYMPMGGQLFEIMHVENEIPFYALQHLPSFVLSCELFEYEHQDIDTGIDSIDKLQRNSSSINQFKVENLTDTFAAGEDIEFTSPIRGVFASAEYFSQDGDVLTTGPITFSSGDQERIIAGDTIEGKMSGATCTISERIMSTRMDNNTPEDPAQNKEFDNLEFIDFSESNPFGEPGGVYT